MKLKCLESSLPCGTHHESKASFAENEKQNQDEKKKNSLVDEQQRLSHCNTPPVKQKKHAVEVLGMWSRS